MAIDPTRARIFVRLWTEKKRYTHPITRWADYNEAMSVWQANEYLRPLIDEVARDYGCTPLEAYKAAQELRALGVKLHTKEDEARFLPKVRSEFDWRKFGEMLIRTRSPKMVCAAFSLDDEQFIRLVGVMTKSGVNLPPGMDNPKDWKDLPDWLSNRMRLALYPQKFTPEEKRSVGGLYRVKRPKGKKSYYFSGTGNYRPRAFGKNVLTRRKADRFRRMSKDTIAYLASYSF